MDEAAETGSAREQLAYHGGDLAAARNSFPDAAQPWLDLSTGINPRAYPVEPLDPDVWRLLPGRDALRRLEAEAATAYRASDPAFVVAAPGTQALIQLLPRLMPARDVGLLGFTYAEHARVWAAAGARVTVADTLRGLAGRDVAVVVNPNNPDGRLVTPGRLCEVAGSLPPHGLLVVDEAFMDVVQPSASLVPDLPARAVVLRSFGKVFGLAGLRLGFAIAAPEIAATLRSALGPWAVSGPAAAIGATTLADAAWLRETLIRLDRDARRLDALLREAGLEVAGGTALFRLARSSEAQAWFRRLARAGILTRPFASRPDWLRFGLCGDEAAWDRLTGALRHAPD